MAKPIEVGTELDGGKYKVLRLLGHGGMGTVFEAEQRHTLKRVAIKCLHPRHAADPDVAERMLREARATARVRHPNVVDIYDVGRDGETIYLVMELLEGETLSQPLARRDLPMHVAIGLLTEAMRGVAAAHKQGVIHRDIKPDNIFLARVADVAQPVPKVLDFGISKLAARYTDEARALTRSGTAVGTPCYMSYEQLSGEVEIDGRADVYAFGVILYEALTGRVPYEADTFPELIVRFSTKSPPEPKALRPEIPGVLSRVVMWALARERDERIASVEALIMELEPFVSRRGMELDETELRRTPASLPSTPPLAATGPSSQSAAAPPRTHAGPETQPARGRPRWQYIALALGVVLIVTALLKLLSPRESQVAQESTVSPALAAPPPQTVSPRPASPRPSAPHGTSEAAPASDSTPTPEPALPRGQLPAAAGPRSEPRTLSPRQAPEPPAVRTHAPAGRRPRDLGIY